MALLGGALLLGTRPARPPGPEVVLPAALRAELATVFERTNAGWDQQADLNTLERMLGTTRPVPREYLGCLQGRWTGDTLVLTGWLPAREMKRLPQAVTGHCGDVADAVGTFHTHPFRADSLNRPLKSPALSAQDLATFAASADRVTMAVWDADSVDVAVKDATGLLHHPALTRPE